MEVLVGPTFGMEVTDSGTYVRERTESQTQEKISSSSSSSSSLFLKEDDVGGADQAGDGRGSDLGSPDSSSDSSSSIGAPGGSDDEDEEENGVVSSGGSLGLASMGPIEDSLPIKRGLSNHYAGKSKSFANLSDICSVKDLQKPENPFNKRRRILLAKKWTCRKSSFYTWQNPNSMPLLALNEDDEDGDDDKETSSSSSSSSSPSPLSLSAAASTQKPKLQQSKLKISFKSQSCFSLTDLQVEEEHQ